VTIEASRRPRDLYPHRGCRDVVAEADQQDQGPDTGGNGGSTSADGLCGPPAGDELSVPAQDRGRCDQQPESATGGYKPGEGGDHGSVGPPHTGPWCASLQRSQLMPQDEMSISFSAASRVAAPSSPAASQTSGRSASAPQADHAGPPAATEPAGRRACAGFRAPQSREAVLFSVPFLRPRYPPCADSTAGPPCSDAGPVIPTHASRAFKRTSRCRSTGCSDALAARGARPTPTLRGQLRLER
jgi:hypothetical protein